MRIVLNNSSKQPIYEQIVKEFKEQILNGGLGEKSPLPSIRTLAKELGISVITTKRAYDELERQGFIETIAGKGSFVCSFNKELVYEEKLKEIEEKLEDVINTSYIIGLKKEEIFKIIDLLYEGE